MGNLRFWNSWSADYKVFIHVLLGIVLVTLGFVWYYYFQGNESVIHWEKLQQQKAVETTVHSFQLGPFELNVPVDSYITFEYFLGSHLEPNVLISYVFLMVLAVGVITLLSIITTLPKFWYFAGMGVFILFMVSMRFDALRLFDNLSQLPAITIMVVYGSVSFYYKFFRTHTSFLGRWLVFAGITLVLCGVIVFFSNVGYPFLHLTVTGYTPALMITVIFILMVAHEIPAGFVYIVSHGTLNSRSFQHFIIITAIYLVNVLLAALHEAGVVQWDFIYINLYLLFTISVLLSLWGFRQREAQYENIFSFEPFGAFFILSLAAISLATLGWLLGNANDAALKIIRDMIAFAHFGYGIIFVTYILSNFAGMLFENRQVYRVLFKPNRMPYFTFRLAGFIVVLAFVFYSRWQEYVYHGISGFYNQLAGLYHLLEKPALSEAYYTRAKNYGFQNHHANYALAKREVSAFDAQEALKLYALANGRRPSEFSLANEGMLLLADGELFKSIRFFRNTLRQFPGSGPLQNNLGFAYGKKHQLDSAFYLLNQARKNSLTKNSAELNISAYLVEELLPVQADSLLQALESAHTGVMANAMVLASVQNKQMEKNAVTLPTGSLDVYEATLLNNFIINQSKTLDTAFINRVYNLSDDSLNADYSEALKSSLAHESYFNGQVFKAFSILGELAYISQRYEGKYNYIMGLWALEQGNAELAASYFNYAIRFNYKEAALYKAIALTEAKLTDEAVAAWQALALNGSEEEKILGNTLLQILSSNFTQALNFSDEEKYQYCRYNVTHRDSLQFDRLVKTFADDNYKALALADMAELQYRYNRLPTAARYISETAGMKITDKNLFDRINQLDLLLLSTRGAVSAIATKINTGITFDLAHTCEKVLYTALIQEASGDTLQATKNYLFLANANPFFEEGIIQSARYFKSHSSDALQAYKILAEAVQLNRESVRLFTVYIAEATRMGFEDYAAGANERVQELLRR